jgi:predicted CopG family antitoxin
MPTRAVSMNDDLYVDIHKEMERTSDSFSAVIVRRLNKLIEMEKKP